MKDLLFSMTKSRAQIFTRKLSLAIILFLSFGSFIKAQVPDDFTAPEVSEFSFTPSIIDTTDGPQTVTVQIRATDAGRGVDRIVVTFRSPTGNHSVSTLLQSQHLISGNDKDGVYRGTVVFPQYSKAGTWSNFSIMASDGRYSVSSDGSRIIVPGTPTQLQVTSHNEDVTPPAISEFSITPAVVDFSDGATDVTFAFRAVDKQTGFESVYVFFTRSDQQGGLIYRGTRIESINLVSGDDKDGFYRKFETFSRHKISPGIYDASIYVYDKLGNRSYYSLPAALEVKAPRAISVNGRVLNSFGRGVPGAVVTLTDSFGSIRFVTTNNFGYYHFDRVRVGEYHTFEVKHKRYKFTPQSMSINEQLTNITFVANPASE